MKEQGIHWGLPAQQSAIRKAHAVGIYHTLALALACLALAAVMVCGLGRFPGLHGDEAWFGLEAQDVLANGLSSVSGMTWYTGNLYPLALAGTFALFGEGVFELRALGVTLNIFALLILALMLAKKFGFSSAWLYICLSGVSLYTIWQNRVGWEVTAFTLPLLALILVSILPRWNSRPGAAIRSLFTDIAVLSLFWVGALNHLIFVIATGAFAGAAIFVAFMTQNRHRAQLAVLMTFALAMTPLVFIRKLQLVEALPALPSSLFLLTVPPVIFGLLYAFALGPATLLLMRFIGVARRWAKRSGAAPFGPMIGLAVLSLLLAPFFLRSHGLGFAMAASGLGSAQRMTGIGPGMAIKIVAVVLGVVFTGLLVAGTALAWRRSERQDGSLHFLIAATALSFVLLPFFVSDTSLRYYAIPHALLLISAAAAWGTLLGKRPRPLLMAALTLAPAAVCAFALSEQLRLESREPIYFRLGSDFETSAHFLQHKPLIDALRANKACKLREAPFFIEKPVQFLYNAAPWLCDPNTVCRADYCLEIPGSCTAKSGYFNVFCSRTG
jgi:hypothetical protein